MATEATQRSAASMSYANYGSAGSDANRQERMQLTREAQRAAAGPAVVNFYARLNPAINPARSHLNIDRVNDGAGGFRRTRSIDEVTTYGDGRVDRLRPGLKDGNRHMVTVVGHLPWAYCEPDGTEYQVLDKNGQPRFLPGGAPMMQPRYRVKAGCEEIAERYFADWIAYQEGLIPGGQEAIHGYSIQFDEGRPHVQLQADPYEPNPSKKAPDALKNGYSRVYGSHPRDGMVPVLDGAGDPVVVDGKTKMVREGPRRKMERYQAEHRKYMVERGYEVDLERDADRHDRSLSLADFKDLEHQRLAASLDVAAEFEALTERAQELSGDEFEVRVEEARLNDRQLRLTARETHIDTEVARRTVVKAEQLDRQLAEVPEVKRKARAEGLAEGRTEADTQRREAQAERDAAAAEREAAERARLTAAEHERVTGQAREKALAAERAIAERLEATPRYDPRAAEAHAPAELIRNLKGLRDQTGEPVLAVAHRMGLENAERQGGRPGGVSKEMFMTETAHQRAARSRRAADGHAERLGQQAQHAQQDRKRGQRQ